MKMTYKIARTELQTLFYSPIAWLILIIFTIQSVLLFTTGMGVQAERQELGYNLYNLSVKMFGLRGLFGSLQQYLYLYIPLLTMGLMSREFSSGSIKLLYSSPVTNQQIIFGKYLSMILYTFILSAILSIFIVIAAFTIENFDVVPVLTALLGILLLISAYAAIGLFMSTLTSYQVVAAIGTFITLFVLDKVGRMWQNIELVRDITYWLSLKGRTDEFLSGLICSEDLLYFVLVITLFLSFSVIRLNSNRQKIPTGITVLKYTGILLIAVTLGFISSRPVFMAYYDGTKTKANTLTQNSQDVVKQLKGGFTITTYVNILDEFFWIGLPHSEIADRNRFKQYTRFKPETKMNYVHYYAKAKNPSLDKRYPNLSDEERMKEYARVHRLDTARFKTPEEINKIENLQPEGYKFVRTLERESGEKSFLRVFYDAQMHPSEAEITAAIKRLVTKVPKVAFVTGHGEREYSGDGDRDYSKFAEEKTFRYSLINQGFDIEEITLDNPISQEIDILVVSDPRKPYSTEHLKNIHDYITTGRNLIVAGEPGRQEVMNKIISPLGVSFLPGRVVKEQENYQADFIITVPSNLGAEKAYQIENMKKYENVVTMPSMAPMVYVNNKGFKVTELFNTDSIGKTWIELETTNFIDDTAKFSPNIGEKLVPNSPAALSLERTINNKEQKIIVLADADCISNGEVGISRRNIPAANYNLINASFYWLSNEEVPIDVRRPTPPDNKVNVTAKGMRTAKWILIACLPFAMFILYLLIWIRRRSR